MIYIDKIGYIGLEFCPAIKTEGKVKYDYEKRKHYYFSIRDIGTLLSIDKIPVDLHLDIKSSNKEGKCLVIERLKEKERLTFTYKEHPNIEIKINVEFNQLKIIQELIEVRLTIDTLSMQFQRCMDGTI